MKSISTCKLVAFSIAIKSRRQRFIPVSASISIPNVVDIYTDGSCLNNGKKSAISGIGLYFPTRLQMYVTGEIAEVFECKHFIGMSVKYF